MDGIIIILESGVGIHIGDTQVTFGHMINGGIIFLLGLFARILDRRFNRDQDYLELHSQEKDPILQESVTKDLQE
jgi:hypothetical protein